MNHNDLDRILSKEEEILPSSGFATAVMDAVQREASTPPPIPFPWKRALPGLAVAAFALVWGVICLAALLLEAPATLTPAEPTVLAPILQAIINPRAGWIALVLLRTLVSLRFSMHLTSGRR